MLSRTLFVLAIALPAHAQTDEAPRPIQTPALDSLVRRGFLFDRAYCMGSMGGAVCVPSRAMLMTGRSLHRSGEGKMLPELLREHGFSTFGTGKWHNGRKKYARSFTHGGSIFFGGMGPQTMLPVNSFDPEGVFPREERQPLAKYTSEAFADAAIGFLDSHDKDKPFFAYVAFTAPHDPRTAPPEDRARYEAESLPLPPNYLPQHPFNNGELVVRDEKLADWPRTPEAVRAHLADYYALITHMDRQIGRILVALEKNGHADDTLIVFASDHGLAIGSHGLMGKQNLYEHSMRAPVIVAGPSVPHGRSEALVYLYDLFPTVCAGLGLTPPETVEGHDLWPAIQGRKFVARDSIFTMYRDRQRAVRDERWKLIRYPLVDVTQLFDLQEDPFELKDLSADPAQAERIAGLWKKLEEWQERSGDEAPLRVDEPGPRQFDFEPHRKR